MYEAVYGELYQKVGTYGDGKMYKCPIPDPPLEKEMRNYDKRTKDQKFHHEVWPSFRKMNRRAQYDFVRKVKHLRKNGEWWLIKGQPVYLTGDNWFFLNLFTLRNGKRPDYRYNDSKWYWFWEMIKRDENCTGMLELKPRRIGETEKISSTHLEHATRVRMSRCGITSKTNKDAEKLFGFIAKANARLPRWVRPVNDGNDIPKRELNYSYPGMRNTVSALKQNKVEKLKKYPALESCIDFRATVLGAYDGEVLNRKYWDEFGKVPSSKVDIEAQLGVLTECATMNVGTEIVGKLILASTIEDMDEGKQSRDFKQNLEIVETLWNASDPEERDETGRTGTGLYRLFRSYLEAAPCDDYGFPKTEDAKKQWNAKVLSLEKKERWGQLARYKRKYPSDEMDALSPSADECDLHPAIIGKRIRQIQANLSWEDAPIDHFGNVIRPKAIKGNLEWEHGIFGGNVKWYPSKDGRWEISQHPVYPNRKKNYPGGKVGPGNVLTHKLGCDPIGTMTGSRWRSKGAFCVFRSEDPAVEMNVEGMKFDDNGLCLTPWLKETNQFVCTYTYRHDNPYYFYEDLLKTCFYYGVMAFIEESTHYVEGKFMDDGYFHWLQRQPKEIGGNPKRMQAGAKPNQNIIDTYVSLLKQHIFDYWFLYHHLNQIRDMQKFNVGNRTKRDISVASGYTLLADMDGRYSLKRKKKENQESRLPYRIYNHAQKDMGIYLGI